MYTKEDLLKAGFELILENPSIDRAEWAQAMVESNPEIVDDVYGLDLDTLALLEDVWDCDDYEDPETRICLRISDWASFFAGNHAIEVYTSLRHTIVSLVSTPQSET